ncbi:hypothetical protein DITRI_Ditri13aG0088400 [Diplodiscus trichospermus]
MAKVGIRILFFLSMSFIARSKKLPLMPGQISTPRSYCASQFSLANYACSRVPLVPFPPPIPPPAESGHGNGHRQGHKHRHRHRHRDRVSETPEQSNCCQWLKTVDVECVCEILVHMPAFLSRPNHRYTVVVDETCSLTFSCRGRLRP